METQQNNEIEVHTLHDLMAWLEQQVVIPPEKRTIIMAQIKTWNHADKLGVYHRIGLHFVERQHMIDRPSIRHHGFWAWFLWGRGYMRLAWVKNYLLNFSEFISLKIETHSIDNWGSLVRNMEWVEKYAQPRPRDAFKENQHGH